MFSPVAWLTMAANFQSANEWFSWTLFVIGLLGTGWIACDDVTDRIHVHRVIIGIIWSTIVALAWPLVIAAIPILMAFAVIIGVVMLPRWLRVWLRVRKVKKAAMKAMTQSVDKA